MDAIGIFDSGVGGLSVCRQVAQQLPAENLIYFADQAHVPYGPRSMSQIRQYATAITHFLLGQGARVIVVACNTASAAALYHLRAAFPHVPFVGMEPAVKPAAESSRNGVIGVIATPATFQGELFASLIERFASDVQVLTQVCPGLVDAVEAGEWDAPATEALLRDCLDPLIQAGIDTLVLGCTHYPFLTAVISRVVGPHVNIIDPAPSVARQVARVWTCQQGKCQPPARAALARDKAPAGRWALYTSGAPGPLSALAARLCLGQGAIAVRSAVWCDGRLFTQ